MATTDLAEAAKVIEALTGVPPTVPELTKMTLQQEEQLLKMRALTQKIHYVVHTEDSKNRIEITLKTADPEAAQLLPQLREGIIASIAQLLYLVFVIEGERV
jgi:hypothetical protein